MVKLNPKCLNGEQQLAIDNFGHLIPCCQCDTGRNRYDPYYIEFLKSCSIKDYETLDEILLSDAWMDFAKGLQNDKGFKVCYWYCGRENKDHKSEITYDGDKIIRKKET